MPKRASNPNAPREPQGAPVPGDVAIPPEPNDNTLAQQADQFDAAVGHDPTPPSDAGGTQTAEQARRTISSRRGNRIRSLNQQWRREFPYFWDADDVVTRRDTLRFLVGGTCALFLATGALAVVGSVPEVAAPKTAIARVGELGLNQWKVFEYPDQYSRGILINLPGKGLVAYSDVCTHLSCAVLYEPENNVMHCPCHEGYFSPQTGDVLRGPPPRPLALIQLQEENGVIYAVKLIER